MWSLWHIFFRVILTGRILHNEWNGMSFWRDTMRKKKFHLIKQFTLKEPGLFPMAGTHMQVYKRMNKYMIL